MRAALYARYSTELQSAASIADQHRALRAGLGRLSLVEVAAFGDAAISGSSLERPDLEAALQLIITGKADVLFAEALDRISRDQEHVARIFKRVAFAGAKIITLSEGEISEIHIGLNGTMSALYLKELAAKTRRGLRGVVAEGRIAAGCAYGYRTTDQKGVFEIDEEEAAIVRRIFAAYAAGQSPLDIARELNAQGITGPRGGVWQRSTILGSRADGTGLINNQLYVGTSIWNRQTWRKDPVTGRRTPFLVPQADWVTTQLPALRIVPQDLWDLVKARQGAYVKQGQVKRPTRPLSGLLICAECGSPLTICGPDHYGCPGNKDRGTCSNGRRPSATQIERRVLDGLRSQLCAPEAVQAFALAYTEEHKRLRDSAAGDERRLTKELAAAEAEQAQIVLVIGTVPVAAIAPLGQRLAVVAEKAEALKAQLAQLPARSNVVDLKTISAPILAASLDALWVDLLGDKAASAKARSALQSWGTRIVVTPLEGRGNFSLEVQGDLAAVLGGLSNKNLQVAGAGFAQKLTRLAVA